MHNLHPSARLPRDTFADYKAASTAVRAALGVDRLAPKLATAVREAVARHESRIANRAPATTPMDRLRARLTAEVQEGVQEAFRGHYRCYSDRIRVAIDPRPSVLVRTSTKWVSGRGGSGRVTDGQTTDLSVCPAWRRRVLAAGIAEVDGLLTTHAEPALADRGIVVYRASWVRQGRGYDLAAEHGHLAVHVATGTTYHATGSAPEKAAAALRRKMTLQAIPDEARDARRSARDARRAAALDRLAGQLARLDVDAVGHVEVSRADSLRAGNCEPGTDDFIGRFLPGRDAATIAEIAGAIGRRDLAAMAGADLTLARQLGAACLVAIRKDRNARRLVLA